MNWNDRFLGKGLLGWTLLAQLLVSCGGTTTKQPSGDPPASSGGASGAAPSSAAGAAGAPSSSGCQPMDAKASGARCAGTVGYRYNGQLCEGIACSCVGSDCDRIFATMEECDRAHDGCYAAQGILRRCTRHSDCSLVQRTCCPPCGTPPADAYLALGYDALSPEAAMICLGDPGAACPECESGSNPSVYAACIDAQCSVVDVTEFASCLIDTDCRLVSKDCCDCGGDFRHSGVMAVNYSYKRPARCDGVGCDDCVPVGPSNTYAVCLTDRGICGVIAGTH
jgi:hypothetical protein